MNNKTFWMGLAVLFVIVQAIGFVVHQVWLTETYRGLANLFRPEPEMMSMMWMMVVGQVFYLFLFCYIFTKGRESGGIGEGARYGLLIGLLLSIPMTIDQYVVYPIPGKLAVIWFVVGVLSSMIMGAVFALIYRPS
jgi:hypothetical protein